MRLLHRTWPRNTINKQKITKNKEWPEEQKKNVLRLLKDDKKNWGAPGTNCTQWESGYE